MALRFVDSFDHYATADLGNKYELLGNVPVIVGTNRNGGQGLRCYDDTPAFYASKRLDQQPTWIVGVAVRFASFAAGDQPFLRIMDDATTHLTLYYQASSKKPYVSGPFGSALGSTVFVANTWYYIELKATIADAGAYELRVNGVSEASSGSADTRNGGNASANIIRLTGGNAGTSLDPRYFDDLYICDGTGSINNDFLGDCRIEALYPSGNGNSSQFVGSDADSTDNYLLVDEALPNSDTDYVQSDMIADKDTYAMTNLTPTTGTICGIQTTPFARASDAGVRKLAGVARLSGTEQVGNEKTLSTSYLFLSDVQETKPGGGAYSIADVNSAEFGYEVTL